MLNYYNSPFLVLISLPPFRDGGGRVLLLYFPPLHISSCQTQFEPVHTLVASAVSESLRLTVTAGFLLKIIVTNNFCTSDSLLKVSILKTAIHLIFVIAPDTCIEVGLKFKTHTHFICFCLTETCHLVMTLFESAKKMLNMMSYFMSNDVSVSEITVCSEC